MSTEGRKTRDAKIPKKASIHRLRGVAGIRSAPARCREMPTRAALPEAQVRRALSRGGSGSVRRGRLRSRLRPTALCNEPRLLPTPRGGTSKDHSVRV